MSSAIDLGSRSALRQATVWTNDAERVAWDPADNLPAGDIHWFDVRHDATSPDVVALSAGTPHAITEEMATALLNPSRRPHSNAPRRTVSFSADARLTTSFVAMIPDGEPDATLGIMGYQPVSVLVVGDTMFTCTHGIEWFKGQTPLSTPPDLALKEQPDAVMPGCMDAIQDQWCKRKIGLTAADLGVMLLFEHALTFGPAHRAIADWLEHWEWHFYPCNDEDASASRVSASAELPESDLIQKQHELRTMWGSMTVLRDWIGELNHPGIDQNIDKAWFAGATNRAQVRNTDERIDKALRNLENLSQTLRSSFAMVDSRLEAEARNRREALQRRVEYLAAAFLMPTLVVGFYGANTKLPDGQSWRGFTEMVVAIVILTSFTLFVIWRVNARNRNTR